MPFFTLTLGIPTQMLYPAKSMLLEKQHTIGIEQNNSNIRQFLGRMTRRTKVVSKSETMVMATLKICWYVNEYNGFEEYQDKI